MALYKSNSYSIGIYGWSEPELTLPNTTTVGIYGWVGYESIVSGLTYDPSFDYIYVHPYASGNSNGLSWYDAFNTISEATNLLSSGLIVIKSVPGEIFDTTGIIIITGVINGIAVANGIYEENINFNSFDDNQITLQGGFEPGWPLPASSINILPSGYETILRSSSVGETGIYIQQPGKYELRNFTIEDFDYGITSSGNFHELYIEDVKLNECLNPLYLNSIRYDFSRSYILSTGCINSAIYAINCTGNISNSVISGYSIGLNSISGNAMYITNNIFSSCGTGLYIDYNYDNLYLLYNLFKNNYQAIKLFKTYLDGNYNTLYGDNGINITQSSGYLNNSIISTITGYSIEAYNSDFLINNGCLYTIGYTSGNMYNDNILLFSGNIEYSDPMFVQPESGDFRLDITSTSISKAETIKSVNYIRYPIRIEAVKISDDYSNLIFNDYKKYIKILDNTLVYINPISGLTSENVQVLISQTKTYEDTIKGISSFDLNSGIKDRYPYDYKIISRFNSYKSEEDYYLIPYTIVELKPLLDKFIDESEETLKFINNDNIQLRCRYNFSNIIYDDQHGADSQTNEVYWSVEKNNQYLIKNDMTRGIQLKKYYLMRPDPSGTGYKTLVRPSGLFPHAESNIGYEFLTHNYFNYNGIKNSKYITCFNKEGFIKWLPTEINRSIASGYEYREIRGLNLYNGDLYYLTVSYNDDTALFTDGLEKGFKNELVQIDLDNEINIESIHSGYQINMNNPASFTINKDGNLVIIDHEVNNSGYYYAREYKFNYDYAFIENNQNNTNKVYFREYYPLGVNI